MAKTLVCRCEDVTLHELDAAMERGHRDIESVKRYTGFGTGWCQGKWCLALCARLIAERGGAAERPFTPRPPYRPVAFGDLARLDEVLGGAASEAGVSGGGVSGGGVSGGGVSGSGEDETGE